MKITMMISLGLFLCAAPAIAAPPAPAISDANPNKYYNTRPTPSEEAAGAAATKPDRECLTTKSQCTLGGGKWTLPCTCTY